MAGIEQGFAGQGGCVWGSFDLKKGPERCKGHQHQGYLGCYHEGKPICKHDDHDWEDAWAMLKQISDMTEDELTAECRLRKAF